MCEREREVDNLLVLSSMQDGLQTELTLVGGTDNESALKAKLIGMKPHFDFEKDMATFSLSTKVYVVEKNKMDNRVEVLLVEDKHTQRMSLRHASKRRFLKESNNVLLQHVDYVQAQGQVDAFLSEDLGMEPQNGYDTHGYTCVLERDIVVRVYKVISLRIMAPQGGESPIDTMEDPEGWVVDFLLPLKDEEDLDNQASRLLKLAHDLGVHSVRVML